MKLKKFKRVQQINAAVAAAGNVILDNSASEEEKVAAIKSVDKLGDRGASWAVRNYGSTIGLDPAGSKGQEKLQSLAAKSKEEQAVEARLNAMRSYLKGE